MKNTKFVAFCATLILAVLCWTATAGTPPFSLPIGTDRNVRSVIGGVDAYVVQEEEDGGTPRGFVTFPYDPEEELVTVASRALRQVVAKFNATGSFKGLNKFNLQFSLNAKPIIGSSGERLWASDSGGQTPIFSLVPSGTKWVIPNQVIEDYLKGLVINYPPSYLGIPVKGVKKVKFILHRWIEVNPGDIQDVGYKGESVNGVSDPTCTLFAPYGVGDVIYIPPSLVKLGELPPDDPWYGVYGEVQLCYDVEDREYDSHNILNGELIFSTRLPPRLTISREGSGWFSLKLLGAEPGKLYALDAQPSVSSPEGQAAAKATVVGVGTADTNGAVSWTVPFDKEVPMRVFRARMAPSGTDVGPKKAP